MEQDNFDLKILEKIKEEKLKPRSRKYFVFRNYLVWGVSIFALLASSAALSVMTYLFKFNDFSLSQEINKSMLEILFLTLPYFWILFLAAAIFIFYYNIKHTKTGYRYPLGLVALSAFVLSIFLCVIFCAVGWDEKLDEILGRKAPLYGKMMNPQVDFWSKPEEGRLVGLVASDLEENTFDLVDRDGRIWLISLDLNSEGTAFVVSGRPVRMLGEREGRKKFNASMILPLMPGRGFFQDMHLGPQLRLLMFEGGCTCGGNCGLNCAFSQGVPCGSQYPFGE